MDNISKFFQPFGLWKSDRLKLMSKEGGQDDDDDKSNIQNYCKTYFDDGTLTYANRYSIKE